MNPSFARGLVLAGALLGAVAAEAVAQDARSRPARTVVPAAFPRWDAGGSLGLLVISTSDSGNSWDGWDQKADYRFDVGRYWTTHLKTEVAVSTSNPWRDYDVRPVAPGVPAPYAYDIIDRHLYYRGPGDHLAVSREHLHAPVCQRRREGRRAPGASPTRRRPYRPGPPGYAVPALDERRHVVTGRPFAAGGFKSYISRSVFVRTEGRLGFAQDGIRQVSMLAGVGVDF